MGANYSSLSSQRISSTSHSRNSSSPATNNLPPLVFHPVHGENIRLSRNSAVARRAESFCKGIAFSSRPVKINERVYVRFVETSCSWSGSLRFGFTSSDPSQFRTSSLPKYACPDLTNKPGNWAKALGERYVQTGTLLCYYVTENGEVHFSLNGEEKGMFFNGVMTTTPLWAVIDIYGNTIGVEFVDPKQNLNNNPNHSNSRVERHLNEVRSLSLGAIEDFLPLKTYQNTQFSPLPFHRTRGCNVFFSADRCVAERSDSDYCQGYVFTSRPIQSNEKIALQILQTESMYAGALTFGLTSCNPSILVSTDFPDDADSLLDRPEYWVVLKDVASSPNKGDELTFCLLPTGEVQFSKNGQSPTTIVHVDPSLPLWAFFDLYGNTVRVRMLGAIQETSNRHMSSQPPSSSILPSRVSHSSVFCLPVTLSTSKPRIKPHEKPQNIGSNEWLTDECAVCYDGNVNSVMYPCGHMCMCYGCAYKQWKEDGSGQCPICRGTIRDVIRIYRS